MVGITRRMLEILIYKKLVKYQVIFINYKYNDNIKLFERNIIKEHQIGKIKFGNKITRKIHRAILTQQIAILVTMKSSIKK